jgi:benzoyl-CoA reductase/2-hydroxyglutaryl-CoA dehydratase subunit BcrC/BadD/HgdB
MVKDYGVDGIIHHSNRSCKPMDFKQYEIRRRITEETGIPSIIFDGDQTDPRVFSEAQFETRLQALVEIMEENRARRGKK